MGELFQKHPSARYFGDDGHHSAINAVSVNKRKPFDANTIASWEGEKGEWDLTNSFQRLLNTKSSTDPILPHSPRFTNRVCPMVCEPCVEAACQ